MGFTKLRYLGPYCTTASHLDSSADVRSLPPSASKPSHQEGRRRRRTPRHDAGRNDEAVCPLGEHPVRWILGLLTEHMYTVADGPPRQLGEGGDLVHGELPFGKELAMRWSWVSRATRRNLEGPWRRSFARGLYVFSARLCATFAVPDDEAKAYVQGDRSFGDR